ncbi:MAG: hypothetical protein U5O16_03630 [Rhodococcus sp. (in: high G+C Gram-positive bacteria)]|nr:hypothetical protein [Rhodococcus sp. (in: high G+C Gram-positive bacteria)]
MAAQDRGGCAEVRFGTVMLEGGQWAYRYKDGAELIMMKMPERPTPA